MAENGQKSLKARVKKIIEAFDRHYPGASCSLTFSGPFQLLAATILSAQCTDQRVNQVTPGLFKRWPGPEEMAEAPLEELEALIKPCGFYRHKARSLKLAAGIIARDYQGQTPANLELLIKLPGVGRKTANVVLGNAFGLPGLTVDTHLGRVSRRLGLTVHNDPYKVEQDLMKLIPRERWTLFSHQAIAHGRALCLARRPRCPACFLSRLCPAAQL